ncbi:ABC transporter ATP-binding protein [Tessaracoccus caeni]|uniref:ABC transporter ATP-binding protein n=1 Tax=Tessaracoccus caeni TaxID=3031239 RepID=UPI0023DA257D|nr:ABC transporter ATP-binding protein [Tessaracoccus caeni]MDF1487793.1 ABC transporter ATP-binding protein [Tessaracoccus caeni]
MGEFPVLEFEEVTRTFPGPPPVTALRECSLAIHAGDLVTVRGPSGSGKSTWLHLAGLLDRPTTGRISLNGTDTSQLSERARTQLRSQQIGFVFQSFHLIPHRSVRENVALPGVYQAMAPDERERAAASLIERVGLAHRLDAPANRLSGGEMQRVAIGRALMGDPPILLCDEPTGNLDSENGERVMNLLLRVNAEGTAVVIITHDQDIAALGRSQFVTRDGRMARA